MIKSMFWIMVFLPGSFGQSAFGESSKISRESLREKEKAKVYIMASIDALYNKGKNKQSKIGQEIKNPKELKRWISNRLDMVGESYWKSVSKLSLQGKASLAGSMIRGQANLYNKAKKNGTLKKIMMEDNQITRPKQVQVKKIFSENGKQPAKIKSGVKEKLVVKEKIEVKESERTLEKETMKERSIKVDPILATPQNQTEERTFKRSEDLWVSKEFLKEKNTYYRCISFENNFPKEMEIKGDFSKEGECRLLYFFECTIKNDYNLVKGMDRCKGKKGQQPPLFAHCYGLKREVKLLNDGVLIDYNQKERDFCYIKAKKVISKCESPYRLLESTDTLTCVHNDKSDETKEYFEAIQNKK